MVRKIAFGGLFALLAIFFLSACAPTICPEGDKIKKNYSEQSAPYSYQVNLSLRQGFLVSGVLISTLFSWARERLTRAKR